MPPGSMPQRDELGRFVAGLGEAANKLSDLSQKTDLASRSMAAAGRLGGVAASFAAAGAAVAGAPIAAAGMLAKADPASVGRGLGFASSGDFQAAEGQAGLAALAALDQLNFAGIPLGRIFSETTGLAGVERQLAGAQQRTLDVTSDLARYGIEVDPSFRSDLVAGFAEQEQRIEAERRAVAGEVGKLALPESLEAAERFLKPIMEQLERIARAAEGLFGSGGGAPR